MCEYIIIAETVFNNNDLLRTCAILSPFLPCPPSILFLSLFVLCRRFVYCILGVQRTLVNEKRYIREYEISITIAIECDLIYRLFVRAGYLPNEVYTSVLKITNQGNKKDQRGQEIIYPGQHIARSVVYATTECFYTATHTKDV